MKLNADEIFSEYFPNLPKPEENKFYAFGIHPVVCCPIVHSSKAIYFHSEPEHAEYKPIVSTAKLTDKELAALEVPKVII